jgi:hypothetical protein
MESFSMPTYHYRGKAHCGSNSATPELLQLLYPPVAPATPLFWEALLPVCQCGYNFVFRCAGT